MKVLRVLNELKPSGVEVSLRATVVDWAERGITLEILTTGREPGPYAAVLREVGYAIHHIPLRPFPQFVAAYARLLRRNRYDLIHVHPEKANFYTCSLARVAGRVPVIRSVHNNFLYQGTLRARRTLQRGILRGIGVTHVSVGASVRQTEYEVLRNPSICIYNSFDHRRFYLPTDAERHSARAKLGLRPDEFVVVTVGNCSSVKNHSAVIEALARLPDTRNVRYLHVGLEDRHASERALADRLGVPQAVRFLGQVDDPSTVLHASDCYVMPSLYEGLGNAALEALGSGLPSALADVRGLRDLREFFPSVWWIRPDSASVLDALQTVRGMDASRLDEIRREGAASAREAFHLTRNVDRYASLYRERVAVPVSTQD